MKRKIMQEEVDELICGFHPWKPMEGRLIVGFNVIESVWEGCPSRSGWDNVRCRKTRASFASFEDTGRFVDKLGHDATHSFNIEPILVQKGETDDENCSLDRSRVRA